jgi:hypothetical protein
MLGATDTQFNSLIWPMGTAKVYGRWERSKVAVGNGTEFFYLFKYYSRFHRQINGQKEHYGHLSMVFRGFGVFPKLMK